VVDEGRLQAPDNTESRQGPEVPNSKCQPDDPESIRTFIASRKCSGGRKENLVDIYSKYAKYYGIAFSEPRYTKKESIPFVPLQKELETLIDASRNPREATLLLLLYESRMRISLTWRTSEHLPLDTSSMPNLFPTRQGVFP